MNETKSVHYFTNRKIEHKLINLNNNQIIFDANYTGKFMSRKKN